MQKVKSINILVMVLDLIEDQVFRGFGQNVLIFGADMSTPIHIDNKKKDILVLGRGPKQELESTLTTKKCIQLTLR